MQRRPGRTGHTRRRTSVRAPRHARRERRTPRRRGVRRRSGCATAAAVCAEPAGSLLRTGREANVSRSQRCGPISHTRPVASHPVDEVCDAHRRCGAAPGGVCRAETVVRAAAAVVRAADSRASQRIGAASNAARVVSALGRLCGRHRPVRRPPRGVQRTAAGWTRRPGRGRRPAPVPRRRGTSRRQREWRGELSTATASSKPASSNSASPAPSSRISASAGRPKR